MTRHARIRTDIGELTAVLAEASGRGTVLVGLYFPGHWTLPDPVTLGPPTDGGEPVPEVLAEQLGEYLRGERRDFDLPVELRGGEHHRRVWDRLVRVPYGQTLTYGDLAAEVGGAPPRRSVGPSARPRSRS